MQGPLTVLIEGLVYYNSLVMIDFITLPSKGVVKKSESSKGVDDKKRLRSTGLQLHNVYLEWKSGNTKGIRAQDLIFFNFWSHNKA